MSSKASSRASSRGDRKINQMEFNGKTINLPDKIVKLNGVEVDGYYYCNQECKTPGGLSKRCNKVKTYRLHMATDHPELVSLIDSCNWKDDTYTPQGTKIIGAVEDVGNPDLEHIFSRLGVIQEGYTRNGYAIVGATIIEKFSRDIQEFKNLTEKVEEKKNILINMLEREEQNLDEEIRLSFSRTTKIIREGNDEKSTSSDILRRSLQEKEKELEREKEEKKSLNERLEQLENMVKSLTPPKKSGCKL